jgi:hypothetical protein
MSAAYEWPIARAPIAESGDLAEIHNALGGPALAAFAHRRLEQLLKHGHTREADLALPAGQLLRQALPRIHDAIDRAGCADGIEVALAKVAIAGGLLAAAWDRISAELNARAPAMTAGAGGIAGGTGDAGSTDAGDVGSPRPIGADTYILRENIR